MTGTRADVSWEVLPHLHDADVADLHRLVAEVTTVDNIRPLSEHVMLHLRHGGDTDVRHVLARVDGRLAGYLHLDVTDKVAGASAELTVSPACRRHGVGRGLVERALALTPDGRLRLWSHGEGSAAAALASSLGFVRSRTLHQMRRSLYAALPDPSWPEGVRLRTFLPGLDDDEWLALNARAFVDLPDQGSWGQSDLDVRMREPWFDAQGFLIAVEPGDDGSDRMVGFHWTKVHGAEAHHHETDEHEGHAHDHGDGTGEHSHGHDSTHHGHEPIGEVYVVGVDPAEHGRGLGRALTLAGLTHLRSLGLPDAMLYVDAENSSAIGLYESLGFTRWDTDVEFTTPSR